MKTYSKAFGISLGFHTLMALLAVAALTMMHRPSEPVPLSLKHVTLIALSETSEPALQNIDHPVPLIPKTVPAPAKPSTVSVSKPLPAQSSPLPKTITPAPAQSISAPAQPPSPAEKRYIAEEASAVPSPLPSAASLPKAQPKVDIDAEKKSFYALLRATIQKHLRYPISARRRGMEGEVNVAFVLENTGIIRDVNVRRGESIFHDAARLAVASASGVKVPDALSQTLPAEIELILEFRLN